MQLTAKDSNYILDHLSWELLAIKKYYEFGNTAVDPELKALFHELGQKHQNRYDKVLAHLNTNQYH